MNNLISTKCVISYKSILRLLPLIVVVFLVSCAAVGKYTPEPSLAEGAVEKVTITNPIKITNSQPSTEEHPLGFRGIIVNYNTFTQSLVDALKMEYKRNKGTVSDSAEKELKVKITNVDMERGTLNFRAYVHAEVTYGDGKTEKFEATDASYGSPLMVNHFPTKPLESTFRQLVIQIIQNQNIQNYINKM